jgi:hypothetical protein
MLAEEFVFIFHEGASSYVKHSRKLHQSLIAQGFAANLKPILRVRYNAWNALQVACSWFHLPEPFQRSFGTEELCAPSFAARWQAVAAEQAAVLQTLGGLRRPIELIRYLELNVGGSWSCLAREYESLHADLIQLREKIEASNEKKRALYHELDREKVTRGKLEVEKGVHFRTHIFEKTPSPDHLAERMSFEERIAASIARTAELRSSIRSLMRAQREMVQAPDVLKVHERRRSIELEAELKRLRLIRHAVISSTGLQHANLRPSAWWFPLLSPDGLWFRQTVDSAECYLEPLA